MSLSLSLSLSDPLTSAQDDRASVPKFASFRPRLPAPGREASRDGDGEGRRRKREASHERIWGSRRYADDDDDDQRPSWKESRHEHHHGRDRDRDRDRDRGRLEPAVRSFERHAASSRHLSRSSRYPRESHERAHHHHHHDHDHRKNVFRHDDRAPTPRPPTDAEPPPFVIDTQGDRDNVAFGSLHQYDVPRFHRAGRGRVLGLPPHYVIDRDSLTGRTLVLRACALGVDDGSERRRMRAAWRKAREPGVVYRIRRDEAAGAGEGGGLSEDFLSVRLDVAPASASDSDDEVDYRSIEGKAKPALPRAVGLEAEAEADAGDDDEARASAARQRNAELSKRVADHPGSADAWLALIRHQDALVGRAGADGADGAARVLTAAERRSVADVRLAMYEQALAALPPRAPRDALLLGLLVEGAHVWDTKLLAAKWRAYLRKYPAYIALWVKYLDFQQTSFLAFTYDKARDLIADCIALNRAAAAESREPAGRAQSARVHLYLVLRLTLLMREAGFAEHAVAAWQALLEYNFFRPDGLALPADASAAVAVSAFARFWDSEVARVGEPGAKGWCSAGECAPPEARADQRPPPVSASSPFVSWEEAEWTRMRDSALPARTLDETTEDDPYRVILASDVEHLLADFIGPDRGLADLLLDAFLLFCRLPPITASGDSCATVQRWRTDPFVNNPYMDSRADVGRSWFSQLGGDLADGDHPSGFPLPNVLLTPGTLLAAADDPDAAFGAFAQLHTAPGPPDDASGTSLLPTRWILRAIRHLVARLPDHDRLAEYSVALEHACSPASGKAYAKRLLKQRPACLRLWNAYAEMEFRSGRDGAAERAIATTLGMARTGVSGRDGAATADCLMLWRTWIWRCVQLRRPDKALRLLVSMPDENVDLASLSGEVGAELPQASPAEVVRSRRFFDDLQEYGLANAHSDCFVYGTECHALLAYLATSADAQLGLERGLAAYTAADAKLAQASTAIATPSGSLRALMRELLHQSRARLLRHHMSTAQFYKPATIRHELLQSISLFGSNTMFLNLFARIESKFRIDDRVRAVLQQQTARRRQQHGTNAVLGADDDDAGRDQQHTDLMPHLFRIYTELHRGVSAGSTAHSVRAAFEAAVAAESGAKSSPSLWKLFILFECRVLEAAAQACRHLQGRADTHEHEHSKTTDRHHGAGRGRAEREREKLQQLGGRVRDVFFRGIRACPWAKELVLLAFREEGVRCAVAGTAWGDRLHPAPGRGTDGADEARRESAGLLRKVWNVLVEKELRVHVDLEEWFEEHEDGEDGADGDDASAGPIRLPHDEDSVDEEAMS